MNRVGRSNRGICHEKNLDQIPHLARDDFLQACGNMRKLLSYALPLTLTFALLPLAAEDVMLSGAHLSYTALFSGQIKADGKTADWDSGQRIELHLRDYYFAQQTHHPFAEIGLFYEEHEASTTNFDLDTESIGLSAAVGSAIPLWSTVDGEISTGIAPEISLNIGTFSANVNSSGQHSDDDSFRYGGSIGISGWLAYRRSVSFGIGLIGSYWRATSISIDVPNGQTVESHSTNPSGWDLGARFSVGFLF